MSKKIILHCTFEQALRIKHVLINNGYRWSRWMRNYELEKNTDFGFESQSGAGKSMDHTLVIADTVDLKDIQNILFEYVI